MLHALRAIWRLSRNAHVMLGLEIFGIKLYQRSLNESDVDACALQDTRLSWKVCNTKRADNRVFNAGKDGMRVCLSEQQQVPQRDCQNRRAHVCVCRGRVQTDQGRVAWWHTQRVKKV
jgi:hypothetical protein